MEGRGWKDTTVDYNDDGNEEDRGSGSWSYVEDRVTSFGTGVLESRSGRVDSAVGVGEGSRLFLEGENENKGFERWAAPSMRNRDVFREIEGSIVGGGGRLGWLGGSVFRVDESKLRSVAFLTPVRSLILLLACISNKPSWAKRYCEMDIVWECRLRIEVGVVAGFGDAVAGRRVCLDSTWRGAGLGTSKGLGAAKAKTEGGETNPPESLSSPQFLAPCLVARGDGYECGNGLVGLRVFEPTARERERGTKAASGFGLQIGLGLSSQWTDSRLPLIEPALVPSGARVRTYKEQLIRMEWGHLGCVTGQEDLYQESASRNIEISITDRATVHTVDPWRQGVDKGGDLDTSKVDGTKMGETCNGGLNDTHLPENSLSKLYGLRRIILHSARPVSRILRLVFRRLKRAFPGDGQVHRTPQSIPYRSRNPTLQQITTIKLYLKLHSIHMLERLQAGVGYSLHDMPAGPFPTAHLMVQTPQATCAQHDSWQYHTSTLISFQKENKTSWRGRYLTSRESGNNFSKVQISHLGLANAPACTKKEGFLPALSKPKSP
ncbi:hypothetical protein CCUS01_00945 [Colletotrichum cuscutae]|uniref:Uncharacterized protein n=1 Tax=Colletotrichum cuscutae TaxID=1209917 RepID=A0AAI9V761_9PEZI|nr:hypothetical protein CCUS01_00945 [Colletotrichum cuscutae]